MTRKVVAFEGKETTDKRLITPNALEVQDGAIPILTYLDEFGTPTFVGKATEFERNSTNGEISFDIHTKDEFNNLNPVIFLTNMLYHMDDGIMIIDSGVIRSVNLTSIDSAWTEKDDIPVCPDCIQGKHQNCSGTSWNNTKDEETKCPCLDVSHKEKL